VSTPPPRWAPFVLASFLACCAVFTGAVPAHAAPPPSPAPVDSPGSVPGAWTCDDRTSPSPLPDSGDPPETVEVRVGEDCAVSVWSVVPPFPGEPLPDPLPVQEVSPQPAPTIGLATASLSCSPQASPSTSPTPSASPSPPGSPSDGSPVDTGCAVSLSASQWNAGVWMVATLVLIAVATFVLRYSRKFKGLVR